MLLLIFSLNWLWIHVNLSQGKGCMVSLKWFWIHVYIPRGVEFGWVSPELFPNLWSEALIITATSLCVVMRARALNFELPAKNLKTNVAQCERLPMQNAPGSFRSSNLVLIVLMACVSKKVFIALGIISEHTKRVFNFPEWDRSRKKRWYLLIKPYSAEHRPCKQDGGPKVHTCCPRSSLQSE